MSDAIILDRTCEVVSDEPHRRRLGMVCGKPAVGDVRARGSERAILVCEDCLASYARAEDHTRDLNRSHIGMPQLAQTHEIHRW